MKAEGIRFLVVDDKEDLAEAVALTLEDISPCVRVAHSAEQALEALEDEPADVIFSDIRMPGLSGLDLLRRVRRRWPAARVVLFTAYGSIESAVEAMREGAFDYLTKPFRGDELTVVAERAVRDIQRDREVARLRAELQERTSFHGMWGRHPSMVAVYDAIGRMARSPAPVLIYGESGTGKELAARALHAESARASRPFIAFNAAALPETLAEAELFGARKGSYTGADRDRPGLFQEADGGTLFIDELASMPPALQTKLLRAVQEGEALPLGTTRPVRVDVRVISAVNEDPARLIASGRLRRDLYYRLAVLRLNLPPLRERPEDVPLLAQHFLRRYAERTGETVRELHPAAVRLLLTHTWPGNVRELENVIERAAVMAPGPVIEAKDIHLEAGLAELGADHGIRLDMPYEEARTLVLQRFQRLYLERLLAACDGNITAAARRAGLTRAALYRMLDRLGMRLDEARAATAEVRERDSPRGTRS